MRIRKLWLDGYGRFTGREVELQPGLQIIAGPNEQGKTTVRGFVGDMLYGQKRSDTQRVYDDANELRRPWTNPDCYAGRLLYQLDDGREIEVSRNFERKHEAVQVYDRTRAAEITGEFPKLRNREPAFADAHLGLSKAVFLSTAVIGHMSLDGLGDDDALAQIRERILALADSGDEEQSAEAALARIAAYAGEIGRSAARTRPLPAARTLLAELNQEYEQALALQRELEAATRRRRALREELDALHAEHSALENELKGLEIHERAQRLQEAEALADQIQATTERCFGLGDVREFPLEQQHDLQRAENVAATAHSAVSRTRAEQDELRKQIEAEVARLGPDAARETHEIPEGTENRLSDLESRIQTLRQRLEEAGGALATAEARLEAARKDLEALPDFSRVPADPIEWLNGLANSYRVTLRGRDDERAKLDRLEAEVGRCTAELAEPERLFGSRVNFLIEAREYEVSTRMADEQTSSLTSVIEGYQITGEESGGKIRESTIMSIASALGMLLFVLGAYYFEMLGVYIPAAISGLALLYFLVMLAVARVAVRSAAQQTAAAQARIAALRAEDASRREAMEDFMREAGCASIRELEAQYDRYRESCSELASRREALEAQRQRTSAEEHHFTQLVLDLREQLMAVDEEITGADQVPEAASRGISRYQEYRDAKRRLAESNEQATYFRSECDKLNRELEARLKEERGLALELRRQLRENGFLDETKHTSALNALRAYRMRSAQLKLKRGRIEVLQEKAAALERRREAEEKDLAKQQEVLARFLRAAGADSAEQWHTLAERARHYRETWDRRSALREQMDLILRGQDLDALRRVVESDGPPPPRSGRNADELKKALETLAETVEARRKEDHALELTLTQRMAGVRPLSEIEEERAETAGRVATLELELEAAAYAASVIEEAARDRHARIAPRLAERAGQYLGEITGGAYQELLISRDLRLSVRIPQNNQMSGDPERRLSKGTVDQIYLALRLSLVQCLSENAESIPMLLDDPFANYDDDRLERAMRLLARVAEKGQILVFTCRDDVARAAQAVGAPLLQL